MGTVHVSVRVPERVARAISLLVELGLFKDKSDFVNYALHEALRKHLLNLRIEVSSEVVEKYFRLVDEVSPRLPEEEVVRVLKDARRR